MSDTSNNIVTGQQLGLLGGPLYSTYKTLGAIRRAEQVGGQAIFWLESNDSDFLEIKFLKLLDANGAVRKLEWAREPTERLSCGLLPVDNALRTAIESFFNLLRQTEYTSLLRDLALDCYAEGTQLRSASAAVMHELFGKFGLSVFDPMQDDFREFTQPILRREAELTPDGDQGNFFVVEEGRRTAVFKNGTTWTTRDDRTIDINEHVLVPNVKTRSICQDLHFKTHTYVAGPGEIKYINELNDVYARHSAAKPAIERRMSLTIIEPNVQRKLKKLDVEASAVIKTRNEEFIESIFRQHSTIDLDVAQEQLLSHKSMFFSDIADSGIAVTPTFKTDIGKALKALVKKRRAEEKERLATVTRQAETVANAIYPYNDLQERSFTVFQYMNLYGGLEFIDQLYENYDPSRDMLTI